MCYRLRAQACSTACGTKVAAGDALRPLKYGRGVSPPVDVSGNVFVA